MDTIYEALIKYGWERKENIFIKSYIPEYHLKLYFSENKLELFKIYQNETEELIYSETRKSTYFTRHISSILKLIEFDHDLKNKRAVEYDTWKIANENNWELIYKIGKSERFLNSIEKGDSLENHIIACFDLCLGDELFHICFESYGINNFIVKYCSLSGTTEKSFDDLKSANQFIREKMIF